MDTRLIEAVAVQMGYDAVTEPEFVQDCEAVAEHGAMAGWGGFTYHTETCAFFRDNERAIMRMAREMADDFGMGLSEMIAGFNCLKGYTVAEVGSWREDDADEDITTAIDNAMSWFALEEVARYVADNADEFQPEESEETGV